jgi:hypothetical protein
MVNCEVNNNNVFLIHKNGSLITTAGETGYNSESGIARWSGFVSANYDQDVNSTPDNYFIQYSCIAGSTASQVFAPAIKSTDATSYTFFLNRTANNTGQDGYETMVSTGTIWEIAQ